MSKKTMVPPKTETRRIRKADKLVSALDSYAPAIETSLPAGSEADAAEQGMLKPLRRCLVDTRERMIEAGRSYRSRKTDLTLCRKVRKKAHASLRRAFVTLRSGLCEAFGAAAVVRLALLPRTPAKPEELAEHVAGVLERIERGDVAPGPLAENPDAVLAEHAAPLWPLLRDQERSITDLDRGLVRLAAAVEERSATLEDFDAKVRYVGRALDSFLRLAGLEEEAERLRRSLRRL